MRTAFSNLKRQLKVGLAGTGLLIALGFGASPVFGQVTATTDIDISFPPLIILFYFSNVDVTISAADLEGLVLSAANPVDTGTGAGSGFSSDLAIDATINFTNPTSVNLDLLNSWAVRAVGNGNQVQVSVDHACGGCDAVLEHSALGGEDITISGSQITSPSGGAFGGSSVNITPAGLGTAIFGDIRLVLDLTNAALAGDYLDGIFEISAVSL